MRRDRSIPLDEQFWSLVDKKGPTPPHRPELGACWYWVGLRATAGYGRFFFANRQQQAHPVAGELSRGSIPDGLFVCHACDNPGCVRPEHLFLGSPGENIRDAQAKGRLAAGDRNGARLHPDRLARGDRNSMRLHPESVRRGAAHARARLTQEDVERIRVEYAAGALQRVIAQREGVARTTIGRIVRGETWQVDTP